MLYLRILMFLLIVACIEALASSQHDLEIGRLYTAHSSLTFSLTIRWHLKYIPRA